jgi:hypothetical protein
MCATRQPSPSKTDASSGETLSRPAPCGTGGSFEGFEEAKLARVPNIGSFASRQSTMSTGWRHDREMSAFSDPSGRSE